MNGTELFLLRRDLGLTQEEAFRAIGARNRGFLVEIEKSGMELTEREYQRMSNALREAASKKQTREEVMA